MKGQSQWHILTTQAQREFKARDMLDPLCVEIIVPAEWKLADLKRRAPNGRYKLMANERPIWAQPLFPRYIFMHTHGAPPWHANRSLTWGDGSRVVTGVLSADGSPRTIEVDPLTRLRLMTIVRPKWTIPVTTTFSPGERVRVVDGPFAGMLFTVRGKANRTHYHVLSDTFASMKEIALPARAMEKVAA